MSSRLEMSAAGDFLQQKIRALLGISAYAPPAGYGANLDDPVVEKIREALGGNLQPLPNTKSRWYMPDIEAAAHGADGGDLSMIGQLYRAMIRDGACNGLLTTRTSGLVRLPKRFYGDPEVVSELQAKNGTRSVFDDMCPPSELARLAADGIVAGVGVGELVPVEGREFPVFVRLDPEFLRYRWAEGRWYYLSIAGALPIYPGNGRWVLHTPGGRITPWNAGAWQALGRAFVMKEHAIYSRMNYSAKLANPARAAVAPIGASEDQRVGFLKSVIAWGLNTVFELPPGWDVKIIESNGRGHDVFQAEIDTADREYMIALAGQEVTTTGGSGFANADIHRSIRADLIKATGDDLAYTVNTQIIPSYVADKWGIDALVAGAIVEWDTKPPKELETDARALMTTAQGLAQLEAALKPYADKFRLDIDQILTQFGIPVQYFETEASVPELTAPMDEPSDVPTEEAPEEPDLAPIEPEPAINAATVEGLQ